MNHLFYDFEIYQSPETEIPAQFLLGKNEKKLLVVIRTSDFSDKNKELISKILGAVHYKLEKDAIQLHIPADKSFGINHLLVKNIVDDVVIFGVNPKEIGLSIEPILYQPIQIGTKRLLIAHSLEQISKNQDYKKALWNALQQIFLKS